MPGDSLSELIAIAKQSLPDVSDEEWDRFEAAVRREYGATRIYIAAHRKRRHLRELAAADQADDTETLASRLGISPRRVQQLRKLFE